MGVAMGVSVPVVSAACQCALVRCQPASERQCSRWVPLLVLLVLVLGLAAVGAGSADSEARPGPGRPGCRGRCHCHCRLGLGVRVTGMMNFNLKTT